MAAIWPLKVNRCLPVSPSHIFKDLSKLALITYLPLGDILHIFIGATCPVIRFIKEY